MKTKSDGSFINEDMWIRCSGCGHKLGRVIKNPYEDNGSVLEIKCHSCKTVNTCYLQPKKTFKPGED